MTTEQSSQKRLGTALFYGIVAVLAYLVFLVFEPFLVPLAWAAVLVVVVSPAYDRLARQWGRTPAALATTMSVTLILIIPTLLMMLAFVRQGAEAVQAVQQGVASGHFSWVNDLWTRWQARIPGSTPVNLSIELRGLVEQFARYVAGRLGAILGHAAAFLFHLGVTIFAMFYLFRDGGQIVARIRELLPFEERHREQMLRKARELIFASVTSSLVAAAAHGLVGGIGFALVGIRAAIFWGVLMAFFSFVPLVGSALIWIPASIGLIVHGSTGRGILLLVLCGGVVSLVDNVIRPWLISGRAEMGGLIIFISVLGGIRVFGLLGVVLGPIIVATVASLLDLYAPRGQLRNSPSTTGGK